MPQVLFAGGRLDSLTWVGSPVEYNGFGFDATYSDAAVKCTNTTDIITATFIDASEAAVDVTTGQTVYAHANFYAGTTSSALNICWLADSSGNPWLALRCTGTSNQYGLYYNSGTGASPTWTLLGSPFTITNSANHAIDMVLTLGSPHSAAAYVDNGVVASGTFTQASLTTLRSFKMSSLAVGQANYWSQILCTEGIGTIGAKVKSSRASGAGSNSGWTGSASNVNEAVNSDATVDTAASAGLTQTYAMGDVTVPSTLVIKSVFHWLRAKNDGASPLNIKSVVRSGGTDYPSAANLSGIGIGFSSLVKRYDVDPATGVAWTQAGWNAAEAGYKSQA